MKIMQTEAINRAIGEKIFKYSQDTIEYGLKNGWSPAEKIVDAFQMIDLKTREDDPRFQFNAIKQYRGHDGVLYWEVDIYNGLSFNIQRHKSLPYAICLSYLKSIENYERHPKNKSQQLM